MIPERRQISPTIAPAFCLQILCGLQYKGREPEESGLAKLRRQIPWLGNARTPGMNKAEDQRKAIQEEP